MVIPPVLKTGVRKDLRVRVALPPQQKKNRKLIFICGTSLSQLRFLHLSSPTLSIFIVPA